MKSTGYGNGNIEGTDKLTLTVSTGGWSDNETIINFIRNEVPFFWHTFWYSEIVGGKYIFKEMR